MSKTKHRNEALSLSDEMDLLKQVECALFDYDELRDYFLRTDEGALVLRRKEKNVHPNHITIKRRGSQQRAFRVLSVGGRSLDYGADQYWQADLFTSMN